MTYPAFVVAATDLAIQLEVSQKFSVTQLTDFGESPLDALAANTRLFVFGDSAIDTDTASAILRSYPSDLCVFQVKESVPLAVQFMKLGGIVVTSGIDVAEICDSLIALQSAWTEYLSMSLIQSRFSERESRMIEAIFSGTANKVMASNLFVSERTIENDRAKLYRKLGVYDAVSLSRWCLRLAALEKQFAIK